jgi:hypothetical protein
MTIEEGVSDRLFFLMRHGDNISAHDYPLQFGNYTGEHLALEVGRLLKFVDPNMQILFVKNQFKYS